MPSHGFGMGQAFRVTHQFEAKMRRTSSRTPIFWLAWQLLITVRPQYTKFGNPMKKLKLVLVGNGMAGCRTL